MKKFLWVGAAILLSLTLKAWADTAASPTSNEAPTVASKTEPSFSNFKEAYGSGNQALKDRKLSEAIEDYAQAESLSTSAKGKSQAANAQGWAFLKAKKWKEAKEAFGRAVEADADNKVAQKNLGMACFRLYEYGFAGNDELKEAVKHLEASGENEELLERAKGAMSREEFYAQATATPSTEPKTAGVKYKDLLVLGDKLQTDGKFEQALKVLKQASAIAKSPAAKAAAANRQGKVLLDARRPHESIAFFEEAVKDDPKEKIYLNNLAFSYWIYYDSGRGKLEDLKKSVDTYYRVNGMDPSYHGEMFKMALDELKDVDPESAKAYSAKEEESSGEGDKADSKTDKDNGDKDDSK